MTTSPQFKPLLAATADADLSKLRYPVLASPKLDGIRCVMRDGKALSRKLKPIPNDFVRNWCESCLPDGLDGELMLRDHRTPFNEVSSAIMSKAGEPDFVFMAFDLLDGQRWKEPEAIPFEQRLVGIRDIIRRRDRQGSGVGGQQFPSAGPRLIEVPQEHVTSEDELRAIVARHLDAGYEGTMVRDPNGIYKFGRSTLKEGILLKIKPFVDEEAVVIGVVEQMHNTNEAEVDNLGHTKRSSAKAGKVGKGVLGALRCRTVTDGVEFEIGTGFTDEQRRSIWERNEHPAVDDILGRQVKFKHQPPPGGRKPGEAPRFPVFLGFRAMED